MEVVPSVHCTFWPVARFGVVFLFVDLFAIAGDVCDSAACFFATLDFSNGTGHSEHAHDIDISQECI